MSIVYTSEKCIGCNKCIKVCSAVGACISEEKDGKSRIIVDGAKCVACGSCIDVCAHGAREFEDDTERFFADLKKGEKISILLAPAFKANYPDEYESVLGGLKQLGVNRIISVSFGADITTWGYLNYIKEHDFVGGISQPCPALVSFIEKYIPKLIDKLFPVQSPLMCAAIYARKQMGITDKFAFISPCIAKKIEIDDPHNEGLVQYNVTFEHLMKYIRANDIKGPSIHSEIEYGLGSFYPTPGGLAENVRWFLGDSVYIRQIEGERHLYEWLYSNADRIKDNKTPFLFIDALNCKNGCICGTAVNPDKAKTDDALYALLDIREKSKKAEKGDAWSKAETPEERLRLFNEQFADLDLNDYIRGYTDRSADCKFKIPTEEEFDEIFKSMNKFTEESRNIDCTCCGYDRCKHMALAIYNGFNHKENCIYYEKTMVRELEVEKAVAEEANRAKSSFLANMSHEIRTPINAVLGMNEMILRESNESGITSYAESIRSAGNTLLGLVNNILDFSKIEAGKMDIVEVNYDLSSVINDLVNMIAIKAQDKGLELEMSFDQHIPKSLFGDEIRIKQIITNILTNAVKYTEKGKVSFNLGFEKIESDPEHIELKVSVKDTGIGIKQEDISRLFEKFDRIEEERNRNIEGTGLGMNITQRLLEMMGSSLQVESVYGEGSIFKFSLKQKVVEWDELGDFESAYKQYVSQRESYKEKFTAPEAEVLVIDDNPMNLMVFKSLLKQTLIKVDAANDGYEGLEFAQKKKYDIIFFDHMMPGMDGTETLHRMRAEDGPNKGTISVCLTANAISGAREEYIKAGFDDYLTKPVDPPKIESMLVMYLPKDKVIITTDTGEDSAEEEKYPEYLEMLGKFPGIDLKTGISISGGVNEYVSVLKIFDEFFDDKYNELQGFYDTDDITDYTIKVHAMKSSLKIIGAGRFAEKAQALENAGKSGDIAYIKENHAPFMDELKTYKKPVSEALAAEAAANAPAPPEPEAIDLEWMDEIYGEMKDAARCKEMNRITSILDELRDFDVPAGEREKLDQIESCAEAGDFEAILAVIG
ncbi:MAG: response regulator [Lachnospiraceae bacterium]|nr:response regulator [Lachnospiraceae bacterium]